MSKLFKITSFALIFMCSYHCFSQSKNTLKTIQYLTSETCFGRGYNGDTAAYAAGNHIAMELERMGAKPFGSSYFQHYQHPVNVFTDSSFLYVKSLGYLKLGVDYLPEFRAGSSKGQERSIGGVNRILAEARPIELKLVHILNNDSLQSLLKTVLVQDELSLLDRGNRFSFNRDFSSVMAPNMLVLREKDFTGDTLKRAKQLISELNKYVPITVFVNSKFTHSVSTTAFSTPRLLVQDRLYDSFFALENDLELGGMHHRFYYNVGSELKNTVARNVAAFIPASKKSNKYVVFSAHYDHIGGFPNGVYFPGANDNASGTGMLLEMVERFQATKALKKYHVAFLFFGSEEIGLLGSLNFVKDPLIPLEDIRFLVNIDMVGSGEDGISVVNALAHPKELAIIEKVNQKNSAVKDIRKGKNSANSDHYFFTEKNVPAFFVFTRGINQNYHDINDRYENLSFYAFDKLVNLLMKFSEKLR